MESFFSVYILIQSGGTNLDGTVNEATKVRLDLGLSQVRGPYRSADFVLLLSGEQTRKSGPWPQCDKMRDYVLEQAPELDYRIETLAMSSQGAFRELSQRGLAGAKIVFVYDEPYMELMGDTFALIDPVLAARVVPAPVILGPEYYARFSRDFVACTEAAGYARLALKYRKGAIVRKALAKVSEIAGRVGWWSFFLFALDRQLNKDTQTWWKVACIAYIKKHLRHDLLGENKVA